MILQILEVLEIVTFQISLKVRFELWICKCSKHSKTLRLPLQTRYRFMTNSYNKKTKSFICLIWLCCHLSWQQKRLFRVTSFPPQFSRNLFIQQAYDFRHTINTLTIYSVKLNRTIDSLNNQTTDGQHKTANSKSFLFAKQRNEELLEQIYAAMVEIISLCFQLPAVSQPISLGELSFSLTNAKQIFKKSGIGGGVQYCFCRIKNGHYTAHRAVVHSVSSY